MLVSHWLYFIAGGLSLYFEKSDTAQSDDPALRRLKTVRNLNAFGDLDEHLDDEKSEARTKVNDYVGISSSFIPIRDGGNILEKKRDVTEKL
mmetsp:Transcript_18174/g.27104  ORF Transcript_18174/g.27104 Transcript_18174/m.27104 type:complete len:92 (+) Transcript_18174:1141-1416(+)